tara:strand:- start:11016 stop:12377 length:1362 start_codon:yes stop_codon:yes gene_type:complete
MINLKQTDNLEKWLNILLTERISSLIKIKLVHDDQIFWELSFKQYSKKIKIIFNEKLYKIGYQKDLECPIIKIKNSLFRSQFTHLPAPGSNLTNHQIFINNKNSFTINYDILGLSYWMLNRCEEINSEAKFFDSHGRFKSNYSHSVINNYHIRPIVDEWFIFLSEAISFNFPEIKIKKTKFKISPTIDVDNPRRFSLLFKKRILYNYIRSFLNDISFRNLINLFSTFLNHNVKDPYDSFDWLLQVNKSLNLKTDFYFMVEQENWRYDTGYKIENPIIKNLIKKISLDGNKIFLHPSYNSINKSKGIYFELKKLKNLCSKLSIKQNKWGARMHYLRFIFPETAYQYIEAGIKFDSSLFFDDAPGFRCGTCKEYKLFDPLKNKILNLVERPIIFMDDSFITNTTVDDEIFFESIQKMFFFKNKCKNVGGNFTFIWHNCKLNNKKLKEFYIKTINN